MSENEPTRKPLRLEIDGVEYECSPEDTIGLVHLEEYEYYDSVLHVAEGGEPVVIFRESLEDFDDLLETMMHKGFSVAMQDEPSDLDRQLYLNTFGRDPAHRTTLVEKELTPRQKKTVKFLRYILKKEHLKPEDFEGSGELFI